MKTLINYTPSADHVLLASYLEGKGIMLCREDGGWFVCPESSTQYVEGVIAVFDPSTHKPAVPKSLDRLQFMAVLRTHGIYDSVKAAAEAAGPLAASYFHDGRIFMRDDPLVDSLSASLGISSDDVDDMFREGGAI